MRKGKAVHNKSGNTENIWRSGSGAMFVSAPNIKATHAFTTRYGGFSEGIYSSLNLGLNVGDDRSAVLKNYDALCTGMGISPGDIVFSAQVHGTDVEVVTKEHRGCLTSPTSRKADGLVTNEPNVALTVFTADCVPILFFDPVKKVIGAVHAGWRGTAADISGEAVRVMGEAFGCNPSDICAAIGPCISSCCFETDADVPQALREALGSQAQNCITEAGYKFFVDLKEANRLLLLRAGLGDISVSDECTSCSCDKYWSYRKTKGKRGSQAAMIIIEDFNN